MILVIYISHKKVAINKLLPNFCKYLENIA